MEPEKKRWGKAMKLGCISVDDREWNEARRELVNVFNPSVLPVAKRGIMSGLPLMESVQKRDGYVAITRMKSPFDDRWELVDLNSSMTS